MRLEPVRLRRALAHAGRKSSPECIVHHFFERLPLPVDLLFQHSRDIRIQRERRPHERHRDARWTRRQDVHLRRRAVTRRSSGQGKASSTSPRGELLSTFIACARGQLAPDATLKLDRRSADFSTLGVLGAHADPTLPTLKDARRRLNLTVQAPK